ncbi:MAG: hypothetical protein NVSMB52_14520 [Chloroflexota bacterium]
MTSKLRYGDIVVTPIVPMETSTQSVQDTGDKGTGHPTSDHPAPLSNLLDTWGAYVLQVVVPGIDPDTLHINVQYRHVEIDGKYRIPRVETGSYLRQGIAGGELHEVFDVPAEVDGNSAEADYANGILTLTLPKVTQFSSESVHVHVER